MVVSRRRLLQGSLVCAAGMMQAPSVALADELIASPTADERKRMAALASDFLNANNIPGLSIAIAIKSKPAYVEAFGVADRETGEAVTPQHLFRIASVAASPACRLPRTRVKSGQRTRSNTTTLAPLTTPI